MADYFMFGDFTDNISDRVNTLDYDAIYTANTDEYIKPKRRYVSQEIVGKNGNLIIDENSTIPLFSNFNKRCPIIFNGNFSETYKEFVYDLSKWMIGYHALYSSYEPNMFRMACLKSISNLRVTPDGKAGSAYITFECKPQWYYLDGTDAMSVPVHNVSNYTTVDTREMESIQYDHPENVHVPYYWVRNENDDPFYVKTINLISLGLEQNQTYTILLYGTDTREQHGFVLSTQLLTSASLYSTSFTSYKTEYSFTIENDYRYLSVDRCSFFEILNSSDEVIARSFSNLFPYNNPSTFVSKPLVYFEIAHTITVRKTIGIIGKNCEIIVEATAMNPLTINAVGRGIYLDCETLEFYQMSSSGNWTYMGGHFTLNGVPELMTGVDYIGFVYDTVRTSWVKPRWWTI